tara:strand:- start:90808 stop:92139 length:1332 start_codon:yes stop_codon:yes gene_type:complete
MPSIASRFFNRTLVPLCLIILCPPAVILIWFTNTHLQGSLESLLQLFIQHGFFHVLWGIWGPIFFGTKTAWAVIGIFAAVQLILMRVVPGKPFQGPLTKKGNTPEYKANGVACFVITLALFMGCSYGLHWFSPTVAYDNLGAILCALNIFSLVFCLLLYIKGLTKPSSSDHGSSGNPLFDYYWGTELYPRIFGWDVKQFTNCRLGMMAWPILLLSYASKQVELYGYLSDSMWVAVMIQMVYLMKFYLWETGYLRSIDIMLDRAGFYICWGCLVWVPGVYTLSTMYLVTHPINLPTWLAVGIVMLGSGSVLVNYWADKQRQIFRATNGQCKVWGKDPVTIHATYINDDGEEKKSILLASGWFGVARHFHYVPEILGAFLWTLPAMFNHFLPYFYVVFLTVLLLHRAYRDELKCAKKYGVYWQEYCKRVPSLIMPGVHLKFGGKK